MGGGLWYWYFSALGGGINVSKPLVLQASKDALGGWIHSFFSKCEGEFELNYSVKTAFEICSF